MQLIVLGMHRSGTSVLARLLNLMGAYFGPEGASTGANPENPKGFWERRDVRMLNDYVLQSAGCDWNRVLGFDPGNLPDDLLAEFTKRASKLVLEMDAHRPWLLKEPRLCLLFPLWRKVLDMPACIHIYRHPVEVAASLHARNGIPIAAGLALWERYVRSALAGSSGLPTILVSHRKLMQQPCETARQLSIDLEAIGETGLRLPPMAEIAAFVQRDLYRQKEWRDDLAAYSNAPQVQLFELLTTSTWPFTGTIASMEATNEQALAEYEACLPRLATRYDSSLSPALRKAGKGAVRAAPAAGPNGRHAEDGARHDPNELCRKLFAAEAELREVAAERIDAKASLNRAENAVVEAEMRLAERFGEVGELTRMLLERNADIARLRARQRGLTEAMDAARDAEAAVRAELQCVRDASRATLDEANARVATMKRELSRSRAEIDRQAGQLRTLRALLWSTGVRAARSRHDLERITSDFAWKLAWPMRMVSRGVGRATRGHAARAGEVEEVLASDLFDAAWYLEWNRDVAGEAIDAALHYLEHGAMEQRDPGPGFDTAFYLASNPDVAAAGINPLLHFIRHGRHEGRLPHACARVVVEDRHGKR
jgi:hypothetical protein